MTTYSSTELVNAKFADSKSYANTAFAEARTLLNSLAETSFSVEFPYVDTTIPVTLTTPNLTGFNYTPAIITPVNDSIADVVFKEVPEFSIASPTLIQSGITGSISEPVEGSLENIPTITIPSIPTFHGSLGINDFDVTSVVNQALSIMNNLQSNIDSVGSILISFITNPQQAIGDNVVDAMTTAAFRKIDNDFQSKYTEVSNFYSSRGWNTPQGPMLGKLSELDKAHLLQRTDAQRDILIKNFELSQQNFVATLQLYISYVHENNTAVANTLNMLFSSLKYAYDAIISKFTAYISMYQAELEAYKTTTTAQIQIAGAIIEKNKAVVSQYSAQVQAFGIKIGAISAYNQDLIKQMEAKISLYGAQIQAVSANNTEVARAFSADVQKYTANVQYAIGASDIAIKNASNSLAAFDSEAKYETAKAQINATNSGLLVEAKKAQIQLTIEKVETDIKNMIAVSGLTAEVAKAAASIAAQLAASSMSAVSAGASIASHETYNYDATKDTVETRINLSGSV